MGIRKTQFFGLTNEAYSFLSENCVTISYEECPHCHKTLKWKFKSEVYKDCSYLGMFDDGPKLEQYFLKDGRVVREIVQATPWSSGPCIFLALEVDGEIIGGWSDEAINNW